MHIAYKVAGYRSRLRSFYFLTWHTVTYLASLCSSILQSTILFFKLNYCYRPIESDCFKLLMVNEFKIISTYFYIVNCFKQNVHSRKKHTFYVYSFPYFFCIQLGYGHFLLHSFQFNIYQSS